LPDAFDGLYDRKEVQDDIVPNPLADEADNNHGNQEGQKGGNNFHIGLTALRIRPGHICERINAGIDD